MVAQLQEIAGLAHIRIAHHQNLEDVVGLSRKNFNKLKGLLKKHNSSFDNHLHSLWYSAIYLAV